MIDIFNDDSGVVIDFGKYNNTYPYNTIGYCINGDTVTIIGYETICTELWKNYTFNNSPIKSLDEFKSNFAKYAFKSSDSTGPTNYVVKSTSNPTIDTMPKIGDTITFKEGLDSITTTLTKKIGDNLYGDVYDEYFIEVQPYGKNAYMNKCASNTLIIDGPINNLPVKDTSYNVFYKVSGISLPIPTIANGSNNLNVCGTLKEAKSYNQQAYFIYNVTTQTGNQLYLYSTYNSLTLSPAVAKNSTTNWEDTSTIDLTWEDWQILYESIPPFDGLILRDKNNKDVIVSEVSSGNYVGKYNNTNLINIKVANGSVTMTLV